MVFIFRTRPLFGNNYTFFPQSCNHSYKVDLDVHYLAHIFMCANSEGPDVSMEVQVQMSLFWSQRPRQTFGSIGYLRNLVILNCLLAKTIAYFHIFLRHVFFCDYTFSYCMKPSGMGLHINSLISSAFLKYQTSLFNCT